MHTFTILHRKYCELETMLFFIFRCPEPKMWFKKSWPFVSYGLNSSRTIITKPILFKILKIFCHEYYFGQNRCLLIQKMFESQHQILDKHLKIYPDFREYVNCRIVDPLFFCRAWCQFYCRPTIEQNSNITKRKK